MVIQKIYAKMFKLWGKVKFFALFPRQSQTEDFYEPS